MHELESEKGRKVRQFWDENVQVLSETVRHRSEICQLHACLKEWRRFSNEAEVVWISASG